MIRSLFFYYYYLRRNYNYRVTLNELFTFYLNDTTFTLLKRNIESGTSLKKNKEKSSFMRRYYLFLYHSFFTHVKVFNFL